jgi:hypothetical protein
MIANIGGYARIVEYEDVGRIVVIRCRWRPGDITHSHKHYSKDRSMFKGFAVVYDGCLFQIAYGKTTIHSKGQTIPEISGCFGHIVGNHTDRESQSIHVYIPSIEMVASPYTQREIDALKELGVILEPSHLPAD